MSCVPHNVWECAQFWGAIVPLFHFSIVEYQCTDRVLRQFNIFQPIPKPPIDIERIHTRGLTAEEKAYAIALWDTRFEWLPEDRTPIEDDDFNCSPEYFEWFNENGKPFLVAHEMSQRWHTEQRCSFQHVGEVSIPDQSYEQSAFDTTINCPTNWSPWELQREPRRVVVGSSSFNDHWEQAVVEHPPIYTTVGGSFSSYPGHDADVYIPQSELSQSFMYGQGIDVESITASLSTTTISCPLFPEDIYSTPPSMQMLDDQLPEHPHQRRMAQAPRRYDQTSSLHRQELPRRKRK